MHTTKIFGQTMSRKHLVILAFIEAEFPGGTDSAPLPGRVILKPIPGRGLTSLSLVIFQTFTNFRQKIA